MSVSEIIKNKIQSILNCTETGSIKGDYGNISIFKDGPGNIRQITYGKSQTTEYGLLKELIELYIKNKGIHSEEFKKYLDKIEKKPLVNNKDFLELLEKAALDPIMQKTQDAFFDEFYWEPAVEWAESNGFKHPLSLLVIYDSFIHSGGIRMDLRSRFKESVPSKGGKEKEWIKQYLAVRRSWLATHKTRPVLRKTVYRIDDILTAIKKDDWNLEKPYNANGIVVN